MISPKIHFRFLFFLYFFRSAFWNA